MIKANELRIGNRLWESSISTPGADDFDEMTVASINDIDKVVYDEQDNIYSYDYLYPIPLTPEWLERCGGKKNNGTPFYCIDMPSNIGEIHINPDNGMIWLRHHANEHTALNPYSGNAGYFLHSLQNLYFAMTGEELTINNEHIQTTSRRTR